jgi:hypothetical protein
MRRFLTVRCLVPTLAAGMLLATAGCGGMKVVPVNGTAKLDGKPLAGFVVTFNPDTEKGHSGDMDCSGRIGPDGNFALRTDDRFKVYKGAPPGWYKVTIWSPDDKPLPVNKKYTDIKKTDLSIEVVENPAPGAYDLKFTK